MPEHPRQEVVVVDVQIPFWSMVMFMVEWAIATIPAVIILALLGFFLVAILGGLGGLLRGI